MDECPDSVIWLWCIISSVVSSLPNTPTLHTFAIHGAFPREHLNRRVRIQNRLPVIDTLRRPLHSVACHLLHLIDHGHVPATTLEPLSSAVSYTETEQRRIKSLLTALDSGGFLVF